MNEHVSEIAKEDAIEQLLVSAGITAHRSLIRSLVDTSVGFGEDGTSRVNLKISSAALAEMRNAFRLFEPFIGIPKASIFGSARTQKHDPLWHETEAISRRLAEQGWMIVTGAGPGIMEAAATGAGPEHSLGVSIKLPFEEAPATLFTHGDRLVAMKYFFTRKLMLVKESSAFVCLPGGFGTLDETFELLTLQQTGKMEPVPIVLLDRPGGTFWRGLERFVIDHLEHDGMVSPGDLDRLLITDSVDEALAEIALHWRNYESLRWVGDQLVLRLQSAPTTAELTELNERFSNFLDGGEMTVTGPLPEELAERDRIDLARVVMTPRRRAIGELHRVIRALNQLSSLDD